MILDTSFIIDLLRNKKEAVEIAINIEQSFEPIGTTTITVFEILQGIKDAEKEKKEINTLLSSLGIFPFDLESAFIAGDIQKELVKHGEMIAPEDCMIAGIVIKNKEVLLTRNTKHFGRIRDLKLEGY